MTLNYEETQEFKRDLKKLLKKFRSLRKEIEVAKKAAIELFHVCEIDNRSVFEIPGFCDKEIKILKLKKFACKALKGKGVKSGIRIIYAYHIKQMTVIFLEIYHKNDKKNEDKERIKSYLKIIGK